MWSDTSVDFVYRTLRKDIKDLSLALRQQFGKLDERLSAVERELTDKRHESADEKSVNGNIDGEIRTFNQMEKRISGVYKELSAETVVLRRSVKDVESRMTQFETIFNTELQKLAKRLNECHVCEPKGEENTHGMLIWRFLYFLQRPHDVYYICWGHLFPLIYLIYPFVQHF